MFLELLGTLTYFGILLVRASSYRLELIMCMMTVFTISMFCYILADIAQPYHGVFKLKLDILVKFVKNVAEEYALVERTLAQNGK